MRSSREDPPALDFRLFFNSAPGLCLVLSPDLTIVAANDAYLCATKTERESIVGRGLFEVIPDRPPRGGGLPLRVSLERVLRTGMADAMNSPVIGAKGEVAFIIHCIEKVTEPEARYRALFENAPDGLLIADRESIYIDANPSACRMLGYCREELIGMHGPGIVTEAEIPHIASALRTIAATSKYHREWQLRRKDGSVFTAEVTVTVMPDGNLLGMIRDVTERRSLEAQYRQAQKMEAIGRLAGGVAHDFNNLLTVILGYCEVLVADSPLDDPRLAAIIEIQSAGTQAGKLTHQLLAFSRKESVEPGRLDLNRVTVGLQSMLRRLIGEHIEVVMCPDPGLVLVKADRGQVEQIVLNLVVNARDAMPGGGILTIETASVELDEHYATLHAGVKPGAYARLTVTDTGTGMTPEVQARLFEPFFTTKEPGKGTGLGMATVYSIVTQSGGTVQVQSEVGKGTAVEVYFPRLDPAELHAGVAAAPVVRPLTGTQTVLVVEDEEGVRVLARTLLERQGYTVLIAANAAEALQVFAENPAIDLVLTDVVMPGTSGPELTKRLMEYRPALKVIYMSGYTEDAIVKHGVLEPGIAFLNKPFTSQTLGETIRDALGR